ncbi:MAG: SDR family NAD(P)-dependent oxidoreductase [Chloroflexi bacterium]|nr:SDR family NAD(P)-dependent oxidoreductase [Chloroflexota bacterium]
MRNQHNIHVTVLAKDLSRLEAPTEIYEALQGAGTAVDVLINNAGFASYGLFHELDRAKELEMVQLNITNLVALTHLFVEKWSGGDTAAC